MAHKRIEEEILVAHSQGGLGNQLFIIAAGYSMALRNKSKLQVDIGLHKFPKMRKFRAGNFLDKSQIPVEIIDLKWSRYLLALQSMNLSVKCTVNEDNYFDRSSGCLWGFYQSEIFHEFGSIEIYELFQKNLKNLVHKDFKLPGSSDLVAHVRRGDYSIGSAAKVHGCIDLDYFKNSFAQFPDKDIKILSDDFSVIDEIKNKIPERNIEMIQGGSEYDDLFYLTQASTLVISNSSFSWWGARLGNPNKTVVAPERWYRNPPKHYKKIQLEDWNLVPNEFESL